MHRFVSSHVPSIGVKTTPNVVFDQVESFVQVITQVDEHRLCAHVTFKQVTGEYAEIFNNLKLAPFSCQLFLDRLKSQSKFPYRICFVVPKVHTIVKKISEVKRYTNSERNKLIEFHYDGFTVKTEFLHAHDYNFILKYLKMFFQSSLKFNPYMIRSDSPLSSTFGGKNSAPNSPSFLTSSLRSQSLKSSKMQFYDLPTERWKFSEIRSFFNHQWIQDGRKVVPLGEYLKKSKDLNLKELDKFFRASSKKKTRNLDSLLQLIQNYDRDPSNEDIKIQLPNVLETTVLRNRLREILGQLKLMKNFASNEYLQVLKKKISTKREEITLQEVERDLLFKERHLWDPEECRDELLMMILFNKELESYVTEKEELFEEYKKQELSIMLRNKKLKKLSQEENEGEDDDDSDDSEEINEFEYVSTSDEILDIYHNEEPSEIEETSPEEFDHILKSFSITHKFHIDNLSFKYSLLSLQNDILREEKKIEKKYVFLQHTSLKNLRNEIRKLESKNEELQESQILKTDELLMLMDDVDCDGEELTQLESELEILQGKIDLVEGKITKKEKEMEDIKLNMENLRKQIEKKKKSRIGVSEGFLRDELRKKFFFSNRRRKELSETIKEKIKELGYSGNFELKVKLVLSQFTQARAADWQRWIMGIVDPIMSPKYYQFGFLHASVLVKNIGFHWFKNALVFTKEVSLSDSYDDIICIDADCPMVCDETSLVLRITNLAEEVVFWNAYMNYAPYQSIFGSSKNLKNCQEFSLSVLDKLEYTDFYPYVKKYLDDLKVHVRQHSNDETKMREVRFFKIDHEFYKKFEKAIFSTGVQCVSFHPKKKYPQTFVFERHYELDNFVRKCKEIDYDFEYNYPDMYQLLKGFDRAFHMKYRKTPSDIKTSPSEDGCPFLRHYDNDDDENKKNNIFNRNFF